MQNSLQLPRSEWEAHPNFPSQVLLLGSHESFRRVSRELIETTRAADSLAWSEPLYHGHFKCSLRRVVDYPNTWSYVRDLYQTAGFGDTVHVEIYKSGYYGRSPGINPRGIVPLGPEIDFNAAHERATRF